MHYPTPKNPFLLNFIESLRKRNKALKYKASSITCERVLVREEGEETEKLELLFEAAHTTAKLPLSVHVWEDRWVWVSIRLLAKQGVVWAWRYEGRLLGNFGGREIIAAIEKTIDKSFDMKSDNVKSFEPIWRQMLAQGPKQVLSN